MKVHLYSLTLPGTQDQAEAQYCDGDKEASHSNQDIGSKVSANDVPNISCCVQTNHNSTPFHV